MTCPQSSAPHLTLSSSNISLTSCSVSRRLCVVRALRSMGHCELIEMALVMQSLQKVCLHDAVVTGSTKAD